METEGKKNAPKSFSKHLKYRICKIKQYLNYILITTNQNTLRKPEGMIKSVKNSMKNFTPMKQLQKLLILNFLAKFLTERNNERFKLCEAKIYLDDIIKSINSYTNSKFPGNGSLTAELYIHFSNELAPVLLDVYDSWGKLRTMSVTSRTGIIFIIYEKGDEKDIENGSISFLKLRS